MRVVLFVHEWAVGDRVAVVFAALRVSLGATEVDRFTASCKSEQWRNSARLGSKLLVASRVFEWLVLGILKIVLYEIKNGPRCLPEEYFLLSGVSFHR